MSDGKERPTSRQAALEQLNTADAEAVRCTAEMSAAAKAWAAAQTAADAAWLALLESQNACARARLAQQRARLILVSTPDVPAVDPMGRRLQA